MNALRQLYLYSVYGLKIIESWQKMKSNFMTLWIDSELSVVSLLSVLQINPVDLIHNFKTSLFGAKTGPRIARYGIDSRYYPESWVKSALFILGRFIWCFAIFTAIYERLLKRKTHALTFNPFFKLLLW